MKLKGSQNKMSVVIKGEINIKQIGRVKKIQIQRQTHPFGCRALSLVFASTTNNP